MERLAVTIAIPVFSTPPALLEACLLSVADARRATDESFVVVDGPQAAELDFVIDHARMLGFTVVRHPERRGLVANWNACLDVGSRQLVHVMHADDAVRPEFYVAMRSAMEAGDLALVAAGRVPGAGPGASATLGGAEAVRYLLSDLKPPTGSFIIRRGLFGTPLRGFDPRLPYCPDEELFLRAISIGDLGLVDHRLYVESRHDGQARYSTWSRSDFADVYYAARQEGARAVDPHLVTVARQQTSRRLLSVGRYLCKVGNGRAAMGIVRSIAAHDKTSFRNWKYVALTVLAMIAPRTHLAPLPGLGADR